MKKKEEKLKIIIIAIMFPDKNNLFLIVKVRKNNN